MAEGTVTQRFAGDSNDVQRAIAEMERKYDAALGKMQTANKKFKTTAQQASESIRGWAMGIAGSAAGLLSISNIFSKIIEKQEELIRKADEFGNKQDRRTRSFAVNAGITHAQAKQADASMRAVAARTGMPLDTIEPAASALVGSGFDWKEASGKSLEKLIEMRNVTGGGDIDELAGFVSGILKAQGLKQTPQNIERIASSTWSLRKAGDTEAKSWEFLARKLSIAKDTPWEENAALFTNAKDVTGGSDEVAATAWGSIQGTLRAPTPKMRAYMAGRGMDSSKMDFIGENTQEVIDYVHKFVEKLPDEGAEGKTATYTRLFGTGNVGVAKHIFDNPERYRELLAAQQDRAGFGGAVRLAQSGSASLTEKNKGLEEAQFAARKDDLTEILNVADRFKRAAGTSETMIWAERTMAIAPRALGMGGDETLRTVLSNDEDRMKVLMEARQLKGEPLTGISQKWIDAVEKNTAEVERNNKLIEDQNAKQPPKQAKKPAPVAVGE